MTVQRVMAGIEDLTGQQFGTLAITGMASRRPLFWNLKCERCGTSFARAHERVRYATCPNSMCGRTVKARKSESLISTGSVNVAIRSRDSESLREYLREGQ